MTPCGLGVPCPSSDDVLAPLELRQPQQQLQQQQQQQPAIQSLHAAVDSPEEANKADEFQCTFSITGPSLGCRKRGV